MAQSFPETYSPDPQKYAEGWDHIFGPKCECHKYENQVCEKCMKVSWRGDEFCPPVHD